MRRRSLRITRRTPAGSSMYYSASLGQEEAEEISPQDFNKFTLIEVLKDDKYRESDRLSKKMTARLNILKGEVLQKLKDDLGAKRISQLDYESKKSIIDKFITDYRRDLLTLHTAMASFLTAVRKETEKNLKARGVTVRWFGPAITGMGNLGVILTAAAAGVLIKWAVGAAIVTLAAWGVSTAIVNVFAGINRNERERQGDVEGIIALALEKGHSPAEVEQIVNSYRKGAPPTTGVAGMLKYIPIAIVGAIGIMLAPSIKEMLPKRK